MNNEDHTSVSALASEVMQNAITPWNKSLPEPTFPQDISSILPPQEFADVSDNEDEMSALTESNEDEATDISLTQTPIDTSEMSAVESQVSIATAGDSDESSWVVLSGKEGKLNSHMATQGNKTNGACMTDFRENMGSNNISDVQNQSIMPTRPDGNGVSESPKKTSSIIGRGKQKLKKILGTDSKTSSPKVKNKKSNHSKNFDIENDLKLRTTEEIKVRNGLPRDRSPDMDSTSYSPLPQSLHHACHLTTTPIIHNASHSPVPSLKNAQKLSESRLSKGDENNKFSSFPSESYVAGRTIPKSDVLTGEKNAKLASSTSLSDTKGDVNVVEYSACDNKNYTQPLPAKYHSISANQSVSEDSYINLPQRKDKQTNNAKTRHHGRQIAPSIPPADSRRSNGIVGRIFTKADG